MASVGSSHNRLTSAEDNEEALLRASPALGLLDKRILGLGIQKGKPYVSGLKRRGFTARNAVIFRASENSNRRGSDSFRAVVQVLLAKYRAWRVTTRPFAKSSLG
jgi:hypothetical protein